MDTLHVCRYWSEVLCCTITTHRVTLRSRTWVMDFDRFSGKDKSGELRCPATALILSTKFLDFCIKLALNEFFVSVFDY